MFIHGKDTFVSINGVDLSEFSNESEFKNTTDKHDVTTFGRNRKVYQGGLGDGTAEIKGIYDNTAVISPREVLEPLEGSEAVVPFIRRVEGTGAGKPQTAVNALVEEYTESSPVADMVTWSVTLQLSGDKDTTPQA